MNLTFLILIVKFSLTLYFVYNMTSDVQTPTLFYKILRDMKVKCFYIILITFIIGCEKNLNTTFFIKCTLRYKLFKQCRVSE
jgi:hypothetical protein